VPPVSVNPRDGRAALEALASIHVASVKPREEWGTLLDLRALADKIAEPPKSIMPGLPIGVVTGLYGHGGAGKSSALLRLAVCIALGIPYFGLPTQMRRIGLLACEDRTPVIHWRLDRICRSLGIDMRDLAGHLDILDLVGCDAILYAPSRDGCYRAPLGALQSRIAELGTEVLCVDGVTHTFGGNENDRVHVTGYVNLLASLVPADRGAVILVGHVDKATAKGADTGEGYSGSTAWSNAVRSRWYLRPETESIRDGEGQQRTGRLFLEIQKMNYGDTGARIVLEWDAMAQTFSGKLDVATAGGMVDVLRDSNERQAIVDALRATLEAKIHVPDAATGSRTSYMVLSENSHFPESLRGARECRRRYLRHLERLRQEGTVVTSYVRLPGRHSRPGLALSAPHQGEAPDHEAAQAGDS
jgi:RecA-family ATPase